MRKINNIKDFNQPPPPLNKVCTIISNVFFSATFKKLRNQGITNSTNAITLKNDTELFLFTFIDTTDEMQVIYRNNLVYIKIDKTKKTFT